MSRRSFADDREMWAWGISAIHAAADGDPELRRSIGRGALHPIGEGASSLVYAIGKRPRVVRLTWESLQYPECPIIEDLVGEKVTGWPRVYDLAFLDISPEESLCVAVVERVTSARELDGRTRKHKDIVEAAFAVQRYFPKPVRGTHTYDRLSEQARKWSSQLYDGLLAVGRESIRYGLDLYNEGNWGLDSKNNAVWIDFGV